MSWMDDLRRLLRQAKQEPPAEEAPGGVPCGVALEYLFEWLDGEIDDPELSSIVGVHLETCARCYPLLTFERAFREAVHRATRSETAPEELRERVLRSLGSVGMSDS